MDKKSRSESGAKDYPKFREYSLSTKGVHGGLHKLAQPVVIRTRELDYSLYNVVPINVNRHLAQPAGVMELGRDNVEGCAVTEGGLDDPASVLVDAEGDEVVLQGFQDPRGHGRGVGYHLLNDVVPKNIDGEGEEVGDRVLNDEGKGGLVTIREVPLNEPRAVTVQGEGEKVGSDVVGMLREGG